MTKVDDISKNSFNQDFCSVLEFHLSKTFKNSADKNIQTLWCDGIIHDQTDSAKKRVSDSGQLQTKAFIGKDGQDEYKMTITFGGNALSKFAKDQDLSTCIPSDTNMDWIKIDSDKKTIELQLK